MMVSYRYLGYGTTNSEGIAKLDHDANGNSIAHSYTGTGAGRINIIASLDSTITENSVVSEPHTIYDCLFFDDGISTSGGKLYYTAPTTEVSRETDLEGTLITNLTNSLKTIRANKPATSADEKDWEEPVHIEFDIVSYSGTISMQLWKSNTSGDYVGINLTNYLAGLPNANIIVEYDGSTLILKVNSNTVFSPSFRFSSAGLFGIRLLLDGGSNLKYKNFMIYPI